MHKYCRTDQGASTKIGLMAKQHDSTPQNEGNENDVNQLIPIHGLLEFNDGVLDVKGLKLGQ
jgi:hypothetical protein